MSRLRSVGALVLASAVVCVSVLPAGAQAAAPRYPIVFVHGYPAPSFETPIVTGKVWDPFVEKLRDDGYKRSTSAITYSLISPNKVVAEQVRMAVLRLKLKTGARRVDIVSHSMGGVSSRWYLKTLGGTRHVRKWVSLAGPNHGMPSLLICSVFVGFPCSELMPWGPFMKTLNGSNETPGDVDYLTIRTEDDEVVPDEVNGQPGTPLKCSHGGVTNLAVKGLSHNEMVGDEGVYAMVRDWLVDSSGYGCTDDPVAP